MNKLVSALGLLLVACAPSGAPPAAVTPAASAGPRSRPPRRNPPSQQPTLPLGRYVEPHTVWVVCEDDDGCQQPVEDWLTIEAGTETNLRVSLELVQANAHMCSFEGEMSRVDARQWQWRAADDEPECLLSLDWRKAEIAISSTGCRQHCGARASLDAVFAYPATRQ